MGAPAMSEQEMAQAENLRLRAALAYARRGWHVFPLHTPEGKSCSCHHSDCKDVGKHPRTMHGLKDASINEEAIREWWGMWPDANVGISCGPSHLVVLDIDPRHGGDESLADLVREHGDGWLETTTALTGGGGTHYVYAAPEVSIRNSTGIWPGIDIRGDGGYIVAAPSTHESGGLYAWEITANEIPPQPWPSDVIKKARTTRHVAAIGAVIARGERNDVLTSLAGSMRRRGMGEEAIYQALKAENASRCEPPLPDGDIRKIAASVARYDPSDDIVLKVRTGITTYSTLRKWETNPPIYVLRVNETDVRLDIRSLMSHDMVRKSIAETVNVIVPRMKQSEWDNQLAALMADMELVEAPEDASEAGLIWHCLKDHLGNRSDLDERFDQGKPLERDGMVYVTGQMLRKAIRQNGFNSVDARTTWEVVRAHGGEQKNVFINGKQRWVWAIPTGVLSPSSMTKNTKPARDLTNGLESYSRPTRPLLSTSESVEL